MKNHTQPNHMHKPANFNTLSGKYVQVVEIRHSDAKLTYYLG